MKKIYVSNPFLIEDLRDKLAQENNTKLFLETYSKKTPEIKNINTNMFWSKKFENFQTFSGQDEMTKEKIDTVISYLPEKKSKILDIGFGHGFLEQRLKEKSISHSLSGIDISNIAVEQALTLLEGKYVIGDALKIDKIFENNLFDVVIALELIEHISPKNTFDLYSKVKTVLKPNGIFIITTPLNEGLRNMKDNPSGHVREYTISTLEMELKIAGFKIIEMKTFYAFKKNYLLKKFLSKFFVNRWKPNNIAIKAIKTF